MNRPPQNQTVSAVNATTSTKAFDPQAERPVKTRAEKQLTTVDLSFMDWLSWANEPVELSGSVVQTVSARSQDLLPNNKPAEAEKTKTTKAKALEAKPDTLAATSESTRTRQSESALTLSLQDWLGDIEDVQSLQKILLHALPAQHAVPLQNLSPSLVNQLSSGLSYRSLSLSQGLSDTLMSAFKTQRPIRINLDDSATLILKLGRDGKVSAEFLASDKASQLYWSQHISELRERLESKALPYGFLSARVEDQSQQSQHQHPQNEDSASE